MNDDTLTNVPANAGNESRNHPLIFLSYDRTSKDDAKALKADIEASPRAKVCGLKVWIDEDDLVAGDKWRERIAHVIAHESTAFVAFLTCPDHGGWVTDEIGHALERCNNEDSEYRLIPIMANESAQLPEMITGFHAISLLEGRDKAVEGVLDAVLGNDTKPFDAGSSASELLYRGDANGGSQEESVSIGVSGQQTWLQRIDIGTEALTTNARREAWPISLGMTVGLDRGRQVVLCYGPTAASTLRILVDVEELIGRTPEARNFTARKWSMLESRSKESSTANAVWDVGELSSRDHIESVVQHHFERWAGRFAVSFVLVFPAHRHNEAAILGRQFSHMGKLAMPEFVVDCMRVWDTQVESTRRTSAQREKYNAIVNADKISAPDESVADPSSAYPIQSSALLLWLSGDFTDEEYFGEASIDDIKLAILAGRFGRPGQSPLSNVDKRVCALIGASRTRGALCATFVGLPVTGALIKALSSLDAGLRAVAGFITEEESNAYPTPWYNVDVESLRHGKSLI